MQFNAQSRYVRVSPRKLALLIKSVPKQSPTQAVARLSHINKSGAPILKALIQSALANAKSKGVGAESLEIAALQVNKGPSMKRFRPVSRGMAHEYRKRMSHVSIVLSESVVKPMAKKVEKTNVKEKAAIKS